MHIVISGGSSTAEYLISMMLKEGHHFTVIEEDSDTIDRLSEVLPPQVMIVEGDGTDPSVQRDAGVDEADLFIALMGHDDTNLVACEMAMVNFDVPRCIATVNSPKNEDIFEAMDIEAVSPTRLIARMVDEEAAIGDLRAVFALREGDIAMITMQLPEDMHHSEGIRVGDLPPLSGVKIIGVLRDEDILMATDDLVLLPGENIVTAVKADDEKEFRALLKRL